MTSQALVSNFAQKPVKFADDAVDGLSDPIKVLGFAAVGIAVPTGWTPAHITFKGSLDGGVTYLDVYDTDGDEIDWVVSEGRVFMDSPLTPVVGGYTHIKVRSGTAQTPVDQVDGDYYSYTYGLQVERDLVLICAPFET
jgi:hypothetical protein